VVAPQLRGKRKTGGDTTGHRLLGAGGHPATGAVVPDEEPGEGDDQLTAGDPEVAHAAPPDGLAVEVAPAPRRTGPPAPGPVTVAVAAVLTLSVAMAFFLAFAFGLSGLQEQRAQHQLYSQMRSLLSPSSTVAPSIGGHIAHGTPVALLDVPAAGLHDVVVVEGTTSGQLMDGPGHLANTPLPGQAGESIILGKSVTAGAPFRHIVDLRAGTLITVRTGQGLFRYQVSGQIAAGSRPPTIRSTSSLLVLATGRTAGGVAGLAPGQLLYVDAVLKGKAVAAPKGAPGTVATANVEGSADGGVWPWVVVWLAALMAGSALCWWLWARWGILRAWLIGAPILFAVLWALSNEAMRLLPNVA
jgi:sortase A